MPERVVEIIGDLVHRPVQPWTATVHTLLRHLFAAGLPVPEPLGYDDRVERVRLITGDAGADAWRHQTTLAGVRSAARLLRRLHDATVDWLPPAGARWAVAADGDEVIGHGDFHPANLAWIGGRAVGAFDWDLARPASRLSDVAYALEWFAPAVADPFELRWRGFDEPPDRRARVEAFLTAYGWEGPIAVTQSIMDRQRRAIDEAVALAADGDESAVDQGRVEVEPDQPVLDRSGRQRLAFVDHDRSPSRRIAAECVRPGRGGRMSEQPHPPLGAEIRAAASPMINVRNVAAVAGSVSTAPSIKRSRARMRCGSSLGLTAAQEGLQVVKPQTAGRPVQRRGSMPVYHCDHVLGVQTVIRQQRRQRTNVVGAEPVMIEARHALEGVAERQVPDIVQHGAGPAQLIMGGEVVDQRQQAQRVLQPGVRLGRGDRGRAGVGDPGQPSHPPLAQQIAFQRTEQHLDPPERVSVDAAEPEGAGGGHRGSSGSRAATSAAAAP